jgi:hypothetical protein
MNSHAFPLGLTDDFRGDTAASPARESRPARFWSRLFKSTVATGDEGAALDGSITRAETSGPLRGMDSVDRLAVAEPFEAVPQSLVAMPRFEPQATEEPGDACPPASEARLEETPKLMAWHAFPVQDAGLEAFQTQLKESPELMAEKDGQGRTPLHTAALIGDNGLAELLLANGADVRSKDNRGRSALHYATLSGREELVQVLLANHADANARDARGSTPLHVAALVGRKDIAEVLLAQGAEIDATTDFGATPLHEAASRGKYSGCKAVVELLLAQNADPDTTNILGRSPLEDAIACGSEEVAELLRQSSR